MCKKENDNFCDCILYASKYIEIMWCWHIYVQHFRVVIHLSSFLLIILTAVLPNVESKPPGIATAQLNESITFSCNGDGEHDIVARTWLVNGTEYSNLTDFKSQWSNIYERLTINTSALAFPYCSMELSCEVEYYTGGVTKLSEPLYFRINGKRTIVNERRKTDIVVQMGVLNGFVVLTGYSVLNVAVV